MTLADAFDHDIQDIWSNSPSDGPYAAYFKWISEKKSHLKCFFLRVIMLDFPKKNSYINIQREPY